MFARLAILAALAFAVPAVAEPLYAVQCDDSAAGHHLRAELRADHLAYLKSIADRIAVGGGVTDGKGGPVSGSFLIYRAASLDAAKALLAADPLSRGKVFGGCRWTSFTPALGTWLSH